MSRKWDGSSRCCARNAVAGGVYLGVGPEQNLTYIAAIRPAMALRRGHPPPGRDAAPAVQGRIFELATDRADFIALLFSKPRPPDLDGATPIQRHLEPPTRRSPTDPRPGVEKRRPDRESADARSHRFTFTAAESAPARSRFVPHSSCMVPTFRRAAGAAPDGWVEAVAAARSPISPAGHTMIAGEPQSFLSTEQNFQIGRRRCTRRISSSRSAEISPAPRRSAPSGTTFRQRGAVVSAFYVSNVEQYLFQDGKARAFYDNVAALPVNDTQRVHPSDTRFAASAGPASRCARSRDSSVKCAADGSGDNGDALACIR